MGANGVPGTGNSDVQLLLQLRKHTTVPTVVGVDHVASKLFFFNGILFSKKKQHFPEKWHRVAAAV